MKIYKDWLADENNNIVKMPLKDWFEYFGITPETYTYPETGNTYELWKAANKKERNGFIDIQKNGGYGLRHGEAEEYMTKIFYAVNADIRDVKLVQNRD